MVLALAKEHFHKIEILKGNNQSLNSRFRFGYLLHGRIHPSGFNTLDHRIENAMGSEHFDFIFFCEILESESYTSLRCQNDPSSERFISSSSDDIFDLYSESAPRVNYVNFIDMETKLPNELGIIIIVGMQYRIIYHTDN